MSGEIISFDLSLNSSELSEMLSGRCYKCDKNKMSII